MLAEKAKKPNGEIDANILQKMVLEYQSQPELLYKNLTPEQKAQIKSLGDELERLPTSQK
jgi:Spy/CpxP family protein refolding chaperone